MRRKLEDNIKTGSRVLDAGDGISTGSFLLAAEPLGSTTEEIFKY
jgi:hypothetical protein